MSEALPRVLVADDDPTVCLLMQAALESNGFAVTLAEDGLAAMAVFRAAPCDMVLLDVEMPGLTGFQVCEQIRQGWGSDIPVVLVTGHDDVRSIEQAYQAGATDFIAKPINWTLIAHRLRYVLRAFRTLQSLDMAEAQNRAILRALPDLLLRVDQSGRILERHGEPGLQALFLGEQDTAAASLPSHAVPAYRYAMERARSMGSVQNVESVATDAQGRKRYFDCRVAPIGTEHTLCLIRDTTERREAEQKIRSLAYFDTLTGLPNRQYFSLQTERELSRARREGASLAVLFLDLDGFKDINDSLGHHVGDRVLQWVADRLRTGLRPSDTLGRPAIGQADDETLGIARLGSDEFTLLLPNIGEPGDALMVANRIRKLVSRPFLHEGQEIVITASIGIAIHPDDAEDVAALLKHSETAMFAAKAKGRDNCQFYSASLTESALRRLSLESSLRLALERNEFRLAYQPQVDATTGRICAVEALLRWHHPEKGLIPPLDFIPLAEETGLIQPIGAWVLHKACEDAMRWRAAGLPPIRLAVNLSPIQFRDPELQNHILGTLAATGLPADALELEITESTVMEDAGRTLSVLRALRAQGIHIAVDDFGTGYSSLAYLKQLPLSQLKIDRSFVLDMPDSREDVAIVRAVVTLAHSLSMRVTAEGVETAAQCAAVTTLGCNTIQGYFFSRPLPCEEVAALLKNISPLPHP